MDAISPTAAPPVADGAPRAQDALDAHAFALEAASAGPELDAHLASLAERGELGGFLDQTRAATALAGQTPFLAERLDPALTVIRDGLQGLDTAGLSRVDRDDVADTVTTLDAHLAAGPDGGAVVPGGGLQAHEDAGGHLIERHVGKSEQWLVDRVRDENISAASSFRDLPEAEHFVSETLAANQSDIDSWLDGSGGRRLVVDASFDASTGISVGRGQDHAEDVFSVRLVLERSNRLDTGYRIVTGYPNKP